MIRELMSLVGLSKPKAPPRAKGRYEVASGARAGLWPGADALSADAALNPGIRRVIRQRCRTQVDNDPIAEGIIDTLANDLVGGGPRLRVLLEDDRANRQIEDAWGQWSEAVHFAEKLRIMRRARATDGESFGILVNNPGIASDVQLDVKLLEAEQVTHTIMVPSDNLTDGIELDKHGNPTFYNVLKFHPGDTRGGLPLATDRIKAENVIHYFKAKRPGQHRGVSDIAPALIRFAYLQRFILATLTAAEHAADHAGVVHTDQPPDQTADPAVPFDELEFDRNTFTVMPAGWDISQLKAEHPTTTYEMFRREVIGDIARCVHMPLNVAILNSSGFNFSSGKLDHLVYHKSIGVDRRHMQARVVERVFEAWLAEAALIEGKGRLPQQARSTDKLPRQWAWPGMQAIDPLNEAMAVTENLSNGTTTLAREFEEQGQDWREEMEQGYAEIAQKKLFMEKYGLTDQDVANARGTKLAQSGGTGGAPAEDTANANA